MTHRYRCSIWYTRFYHAQANPSEAVNKIIGNAIRSYIKNEKEQKYWDKNIYHITSAINSSIHSATKHTPFETVFGRRYQLSGSQIISKTNEVDKCPKHIENIHTNVARCQSQAYEKSKQKYDLRTRTIPINVGDTVYRRNFKLSNKADGYSAKLGPRYIKAMVIEKLGNAVFRVKDEASKTVGTYHSKELKIDFK